jgi:hypothetical protein
VPPGKPLSWLLAPPPGTLQGAAFLSACAATCNVSVRVSSLSSWFSHCPLMLGLPRDPLQPATPLLGCRPGVRLSLLDPAVFSTVLVSLMLNKYVRSGSCPNFPKGATLLVGPCHILQFAPLLGRIRKLCIVSGRALCARMGYGLFRWKTLFVRSSHPSPAEEEAMSASRPYPLEGKGGAALFVPCLPPVASLPPCARIVREIGFIRRLRAVS